MNAAPTPVDTRGIPPEVLAMIPDGHPDRFGILRDLAEYFRTGWTDSRLSRVAPIYRDAHQPAATAA